MAVTGWPGGTCWAPGWGAARAWTGAARGTARTACERRRLLHARGGRLRDALLGFRGALGGAPRPVAQPADLTGL